MNIRQTGLRLGLQKTDDTFKAFHQPCDAGDLPAADLLLAIENKFDRHLVRGKVGGERLRSLLHPECTVMLEPVSARRPPAASKLIEWLAGLFYWPTKPVRRSPEFSAKW